MRLLPGLVLLLTSVPAVAAYDRYGGWTELTGSKTGYFHTQQIQGRWWLVTPEGNVFFSKGVDNVSYYPEAKSSPKAPQDTVAWARNATKQLHEWNFNTAGAWSAAELSKTGIVYAPVLDMAAAVQSDVWLKGGIVDYFSPEFHAAADRVAKAKCAAHANDPWLLGYFTDNELRWGKDWRSGDGLLESYLKMPENAPGHKQAAQLLESRGRGIAEATEADRNDFLELVAGEYAKVTAEAIRRADPNHLVLGCRFAGYAGDAAMRAVGRYFDVISYHSYDAKAPVGPLEKVARWSGKPVMITEFSFKAMDSGLPNTKGAAKPVATQQDRADGFARYVEALAALPVCVGFHWFEYRDEPKEGRFDGENSNYGIVRVDFTPWDVLAKRMTEVNARMEQLHAK